MKKKRSTESHDELRPEYNLEELFKGGIRGKYAERYRAGTNMVLLEPDVARAFPNGQAVAAGRFDGATYLCGYAVEVALKSRICRVLNWPEFPSTGGEFQAYRSFQTHELDVLLRLSGQEIRIKNDQFKFWNNIALWKAESRYNVIGTAQRDDAIEMIQAAEHLIGSLVTGRELSDRFRQLETHISEERGAFVLFALFMREDAPDRWDLIVSAPWVGTDKHDAVDYFVNQIKSRLGEQDLTSLSRIVVVDPQDAAVQALNRAVQIEHGRVEVRDSNFFGLPVKLAFIITSRLPPAPAAA